MVGPMPEKRRSKRLTVSLLTFLVCALTGCALLNSPPEASFAVSPSSGSAPLTVTCDASSSSDDGGVIVEYSWEFGDGGTGAEEIVTHTYTSPGLYTVRVLVRDNVGSTDSATNAVEVVRSELTASFTAVPVSGGTPLGVDFDAGGSFDPDGGPIAFTWDFGDGTPGSGVAPRHTYYSPGVYQAVLVVTNAAGETNTATQNIVVLDGTPPPPAATAFVNSSGTEVDWYLPTDNVYVKVRDSSHAGETTIADPVVVRSRDFAVSCSLSSLVGAGPETFITRGISPAELGMTYGITITTQYATSSPDTIPVIGLPYRSTTTFVNSAGAGVDSYLTTDSIYVKVRDDSLTGATTITRSVVIRSHAFDIHPLAGAGPGTFITDPISAAEIGAAAQTTITVQYTDPTEPSDQSSDTSTVTGEAPPSSTQTGD